MVDTGDEPNAQNLDPSGAFTGTGLPDMKTLAKDIRPCFKITPLYFRQGAGRGSLLTTEYEQMLSDMVSQKKTKVTQLTGKKGKDKEIEALMSDIRFLEVELQRYQQGMTLFRTKPLPKVGRWGRPETEEAKEEH